MYSRVMPYHHIIHLRHSVEEGEPHSLGDLVSSGYAQQVVHLNLHVYNAVSSHLPGPGLTTHVTSG
jgi:hypothetical protein